MSNRGIWRLVAVGGGVMLALSLAANPLGLGTNPAEFGWLQMLGSFIGCGLLAVGLWFSQRRM